MEKIVLRRARLEDAPTILKITKEAFTRYAQEVRKQESIQALFETLEDVERDIQEKYVYVCEMDGQILGSVRFQLLEGHSAY